MVDVCIADVIEAVGIPTDDGFYRFIADEQCGAMVMHYLYHGDPAPGFVMDTWQGWLER